MRLSAAPSGSDIRVPARALSAAKQGRAERPGAAGSPAGAKEGSGARCPKAPAQWASQGFMLKLRFRVFFSSALIFFPRQANRGSPGFKYRRTANTSPHLNKGHTMSTSLTRRKLVAGAAWAAPVVAASATIPSYAASVAATNDCILAAKPGIQHLRHRRRRQDRAELRRAQQRLQASF